MLGLFILGLTIGIICGRIISMIVYSYLQTKVYDASELIEMHCLDIINATADSKVSCHALCIIDLCREINGKGKLE